MARTSRTFRVFVSSTFSDLAAERDALHRTVFPRLRELCESRRARFQSIDLRWGISEEMSLSQETMDICLDEIRRCQFLSPRPNFLVLLGNRYGWQPLPSRIEGPLFEILRSRLGHKEQTLADQYYRRDENSVIAAYRLLPRTGRHSDYRVWQLEVEDPLRRGLAAAAAEIGLPQDERLVFESSATHQEIALGALSVPDAAQHVFACFREIRGKADPAYFDWLPDTGRPDSDAAADLAKLKRQLKATLGQNVASYDAHRSTGGISTGHIGTLPDSLEESLELLHHPPARATLCADVWRSLARIFLAEIEGMDAVGAPALEVAAHDAFRESRSNGFGGRADELVEARNYLHGRSHAPLVIDGESGSGKSAMVAKCLEIAERSGYTTIARFIGATPGSSDLCALLSGLCSEIARARGAGDPALPSTASELVTRFAALLGGATEDRPLCIALDALDQMSAADEARTAWWVPSELPDHVRLIVSAAPGDCLQALRARLSGTAGLTIRPFQPAEAMEVFHSWLDAAGRCLQPEQRAVVEAAVESCGLPLFLKLCFETVRHWTAWQAPEELGADAPSAIGLLLDRLARRSHGPVLLSHVLGYLAAARTGLSEDELLDVLTRDVDVYVEFLTCARHKPPERSIPTVIWSRLYSDLEPYLAVRSVDRVDVLGFFHRAMRETVEARCLGGKDAVRTHTALADYFAGRNARKPADTRRGGILDKLRRALLTLAGRTDPARESRNLSELLFHLHRARHWDRLHAVLADPAEFVRIPQDMRQEVRAIWADLERESRYRMVETYGDVLGGENPDPALAEPIIELLGYSGHFAEALTLGHKAGKLAASDDPSVTVRTLCERASILADSGKPAEALEIARQAEDFCVEHKIDIQIGDCYLIRAKALHAVGLYEEALTLARKTSELLERPEAARRPDLRHQKRIARQWEALSLKNLDRDREAIVIFRELLVEYRAIANQDGVASTQFDLACELSAVEEHAEAIALSGEPLRIARNSGNRNWLGRMLYYTGLMYHRAGRLAEALPFFQECIEICGELGQEDYQRDSHCYKVQILGTEATKEEGDPDTRIARYREMLAAIEEASPLLADPQFRDRLLSGLRLRAFGLNRLLKEGRSSMPWDEYSKLWPALRATEEQIKAYELHPQ